MLTADFERKKKRVMNVISTLQKKKNTMVQYKKENNDDKTLSVDLDQMHVVYCFLQKLK